MRKYIRRFLILALGHFLICTICGYIFFISQNGLTKTEEGRFFEAVLGAGVILLGLPDTILGWLFNSCLYAFLLLLLFYGWRTILKAVFKESAT